MSVASKRVKLGLAAVGVVLSAGVVAFGPLVRYEVASAGARYGAQVTVERIWPTWRGVRLRGVDIAVADIPSAHAHVDEVEVAFGSGSRTIAVRGGTVEATGPRDELVAQAEAWRAKIARPPTTGNAQGGVARDELDVGGFTLRWQDRREAPTEAISATGVRFDRTGERLQVSADTAIVSRGATRVEVTRGLLRVRRAETGFRIEELNVSALDGRWTVPADEDPSPDPAASAASATPSSAATTAATPHAIAPNTSARSSSRKAPTKGPAGPTWEARAQEGADALVRAAKAVDGILEEGAKVTIERVHAELKRGEDVLHVGPGKLSLGRDAGRLAVDLAPSAAPAEPSGTNATEQQALTFRLLVPVRDDAVSQDIIGDVKGGPIWLSTLGIKNGDLGLFDVQRAALSMNAKMVLSGDHNTLRVEGDGRVTSLSLSNKALSDEPIEGLELAWKGKASARLDRRHIVVEQGEVDLGQLRLDVSGSYEQTGDEHRLRASLDVPLVGCQASLDSLPRGLVSRIAGLRMAGTFALKGKIAFDTARLDRDFSLTWDTAVSCRVVEAPPDIDVVRFTKAFERTVYTPEGLPKTLETGPGTGTWAPYGAISKFMSVAVLTTEDGGFYRHRGFDAEAIKNSLRENLKKRRFVRGASTISMQLAKNLYLDRTKNVARKLQEAVLTMYLEQVLTKDQIMELYLNVIELGPMVYGVGPAAQHYFHADAGQLSLGQSLYLSSIMPNPKVDHFTPQGPVRSSWMAFLHKLMEIARKRDRITDEELEDGLRETVVRGSPAPFREPKAEGRPPSPSSDDQDDPPWVAP